MAEEIPERIARLIGRIDEIGRVVECPGCGDNSWQYGVDTVSIPKSSPNPERQGMEVFPLMCTRCGYVRLHATRFLEGV